MGTPSNAPAGRPTVSAPAAQHWQSVHQRVAAESAVLCLKLKPVRDLRIRKIPRHIDEHTNTRWRATSHCGDSGSEDEEPLDLRVVTQQDLNSDSGRSSLEVTR
jgi:hypothetical protein